MVVIRLSRFGATGRPFYYITVADRRRASSGRYLERVGFFNPIARGKETRLRVHKERVQYWVNCGAQMSKRVQYLLKVAEKEAAASVTTEPVADIAHSS